MNDEDFKMEHQKIDETYPEGGSLKALREQALAQLFDRSGWTVDELAKVEGVARRTMQQMLCFGRFLEFGATGAKTELRPDFTERKFRSYWALTDQGAKDQRRYRQVLELIEADQNLPKDLRNQVVDEFGDGKFHVAADMAAELEVEERHILAVFNSLKNSKNYHCERKKRGGQPALRISVGGKQKVDMALLQKELGPIIKMLEAEGKKNMATMSPGTVANLTHDLKTAIQRLAR